MNYPEIFSLLPEQEATFETCFAFSVHKCGSSLMHAMINVTCQKADIPAVSLPDILFQSGAKDSEWQDDCKLLPAFKRRLLFFGFRYLPKVIANSESGILDKRFVLLVRDPRDALVSQYFSFGKTTGSHAVPKNNAKAFIAAREALPERSIDEYVIKQSGQLHYKLVAYRDALNFDLGLVRRYEDVFFDKETFLTEIFDHFAIPVAADIIRDVARAHDIRPEKEDETKHIRKGTPGDHREKLLPETIARLNDIFRDVGVFYGYDL